MKAQEYPLVSFCIVAYQAEKFIDATIDAAFAQNYPNLEIIMSDDGSSDRTFEIMQMRAALYSGPHKIILNHNVPNLGPRENYNKVMYELSHGDFVLFADGDDISLPHRTSRCVELMQKYSDVMSMSVRSQRMDENGIDYELSGWEQISNNRYSIYTLSDYINFPIYCLSGDSRVIRRKLIDAFPPLKYSYSEDVFLFVRSFYLGSVLYLNEPLVRYRQHSESIMGKSRAKKNTMSDIYRHKQTTVVQLRTDLEYAIEHNYLNASESESMQWKINALIDWLCPKRKTVWWRMTHRLSKYSNKLFTNILKALE